MLGRGHTLLTTTGGHTQGAEPDLLTTVDAGPTLGLPILKIGRAHV